MSDQVHLVITEQGIFRVYFDLAAADRLARTVEAIVVSLPIAADYRNDDSETRRS